MDFLKINQNIKIVPAGANGIFSGAIVSVSSEYFEALLSNLNRDLTGNAEIIISTGSSIVIFKTSVVEAKDNLVRFVIPLEFKRIQRREYLRVDINIPVELKTTDKQDNPIHSSTQNLSGGGMQLTSPQEFDVGALIFAKFNVFDKKSINTILKVLRVDKTQQNNKKYFLAGKFAEISNNDRVVLVQICFKRQLEKRCKNIR